MHVLADPTRSAFSAVDLEAGSAEDRVRWAVETFGEKLALRGASERLSPILMTALATGLALVPLAWAGDLPGHEIEHPMAIVILGGLVTSTLVNLFIVPALYLLLGRRKSPSGTLQPA